MAKTLAICKVCGAKKFLNNTQLCKRCNKSQEGLEVRQGAFKKRQENLAMAQEEQARQDALAEQHSAPEAAEGEATSQEQSESSSAETSEEKKEDN